MKELVERLKKAFPTARPRVVELAVEALALHASKNNDYAGDGVEFANLGLVGRFSDICRKVNRLHTLVVKRRGRMVKETQRDTSLDLAVYSLLFTEDLEKVAREEEKFVKTNPSAIARQPRRSSNGRARRL